MSEGKETAELADHHKDRYFKELFVYHGDKPLRALIRNYSYEDFDALIHIQQESFPPPFPSELWWNKEQLNEHVSRFPEGALCVEVEGEIVGSMTSLRIDTHTKQTGHSWAEVTDNGYIRTHVPSGGTLYIVDICIHPKCRKLGLGKWLMQSMYEVTVQLGLDRLLGGGRMPGYHKVASELTVQQYVQSIMDGQCKDPVISFLMRCGRTPVDIVANYLEDEESCNYGLLMEWQNPFKRK
ncbi:GNAT family N-acetyltransferase [Paenibacillus sp. WQ 127069]|uniref:GNAT family N-acetyltransferase n=1 Tax=Paenibacillus baimaensis TaxID=2982185 RepID=A0ABT2UV34_9BACL|nr:GNAT family N-acetyltransferase [Paenibacillus sp. WQ 127069]MCU6797529.1 GNAT family N-acetyltransferase [Paenibacillus sp. WQ 127069]